MGDTTIYLLAEKLFKKLRQQISFSLLPELSREVLSLMRDLCVTLETDLLQHY